ncbi:MAG: TonB-dependent receptor, partial [Acidobacteria bacterium]|nr:TonB-dependent receptor [Acidobacteriota bacterium]
MRTAWMLAGILGGAIPLLAQDLPASTPNSTDPATDPPIFQASVVVTAALDEVDREEVTETVTVIDRQQIDDRQASTIQELLRTIPGLAVVQSGSPGNVTSLFSRGTSSTQTLVLWNGMVLNDPFFGGFDWAHLDAESAERVEVV